MMILDSGLLFGAILYNFRLFMLSLALKKIYCLGSDNLSTIISFDPPVQVNPSPSNPIWQLHVKLPRVLAQSASVSQPPLFTVHSLIS